MKNLKKVGSIQLKKAIEIEKSPFCIGCETLDRELWNPAEVYPFLSELPIKHARLQSGWSRCEKEKGVYDFGWLDASIDGLLEIGILPFLNIGYGNSLYAPMKADQIGAHPMYNEEYMEAWLKFVSELCKRYGKKVSAFEVWNESNISTFWQPNKPSPETYAKLFERTAALIRELAPDVKIIGGAIAGMDFEYITPLLKADADLSQMDALSYHPYRVHPDMHYSKQLGALKSLVDKYGHPGLKLWQAEFGCPSGPGSTGYNGSIDYTENIQAKVLLRKLMADCAEGVELSEWFLAVDLHGYPKGTDGVNNKGILYAKPEVRPKVSFKALQNLGSIVYGDIEPAISTTYPMDSSVEANEDLLYQLFRGAVDERHDISIANIRINGNKAIAYWSNADLYDQCEPEEFHLINMDCEGVLFSEPVLCDLLTGDIYELPEGTFKRMGKNSWDVFANIPLTDYPMIIMEKDAVC